MSNWAGAAIWVPKGFARSEMKVCNQSPKPHGVSVFPVGARTRYSGGLRMPAMGHRPFGTLHFPFVSGSHHASAMEITQAGPRSIRLWRNTCDVRSHRSRKYWRRSLHSVQGLPRALGDEMAGSPSVSSTIFSKAQFDRLTATERKLTPRPPHTQLVPLS